MSDTKLKYEIKPVHDILYVGLSGSWSIDDTRDFIQDFKRLVSRYFAREWACVMNLQELDMLISEREQIELFKALNTWSYIKGMLAQAVIIGSDSRNHLMYQFEEVLKGPQSFDQAVFFTESDATHWLRDHGFSEKVLLQSQKTA